MHAVTTAELEFRKRLTLPAKTNAPSKVCVAIIVLRAPRLCKFLTPEDFAQVTPEAQDVATATRPSLHEAMLQLLQDHKCMLQGAERALLYAENCNEPAKQSHERFLLMLKLALTYDLATGKNVLLDSVQLAPLTVDPGRLTLYIATCNGGIAEYHVVADVQYAHVFLCKCTLA